MWDYYERRTVRGAFSKTESTMINTPFYAISKTIRIVHVAAIVITAPRIVRIGRKLAWLNTDNIQFKSGLERGQEIVFLTAGNSFRVPMSEGANPRHRKHARNHQRHHTEHSPPRF